MTNAFTTREEWLQAFTTKARTVFLDAGYVVPTIRVSVGFTSKGSKGNRIGECWVPEASEDQTPEIFITPAIGCAERIADIHTHELIHATGIRGHKADFVRCMKAVGLEGKPTATVAGDAWRDWALPIIALLGPLPHAALSGAAGGSTEKKQTTRMIKCECGSCGFVFRTSSKWLEGDADLGCPDRSCGGTIEIG
tara:strand:- start:636 stop:1220 length:585 start_codon:yes stop_codon:yes gene_type:complete